jgi:hypothetical protein
VFREGTSLLLSPVPAAGAKTVHDIGERNTINALTCSGSELTPGSIVAPEDTSGSGAIDQRVMDMVEAFRSFYSKWIIDYTQSVRYSLRTVIAQF